MNLKQALEYSRGELREKNIPESSLEGEILLRHVLNIDRASLFSHPDKEINSEQISSLKKILHHRINGKPTAYITGHKEFYGLDFIVYNSVLIPRPETELLIEKAIEFFHQRNIRTIADIGTGSGAIAVSLAVKIPRVTIYATDISSAALKVAAQNAAGHGVAQRIVFLQGNMCEPLPEKIDLIISNLPYVKACDIGKGTLAFEPAQALNGGDDGLELFRQFCKEVKEKINPYGCILLEVGQGQSQVVCELLYKALPQSKIIVTRDFAGIERVVSSCLT